jgi:hypothetical protein
MARVLEAVQSRELRDFVRSNVEDLLGAFAERSPGGLLADYRKAIAFNYAMSYERAPGGKEL